MNQNKEPFQNCPVCGSKNIRHLIHITQAPVQCNVLWSTRASALAAARGDIQLVICHQCAHVFNLAFDASKMGYAEGYENSLHFSPRFQQYALSKAAELVDRYDLHHKDILEIGSGRGDFLKMLVEMGKNHGVGFDPSFAGLPPDETIAGISFIQDYYSEKYSDYPADFILSRHVLEHIPEPDQFLSMLRRVIGDRLHTVVFFEVPNVMFTLHELGIWDVIYEHCSYFTAPSIRKVFERNGFEVLRTQETFENQYLTIEARPILGKPTISQPDPNGLQAIFQDVDTFADSYREKVASWKTRLEQLRQAHQKAVVWGAGSKGITFLNAFQAQDVIEYVVDINPRKEGMFITGAGQKIVPPAFLQSYLPEYVIIMNANYKEEIQSQLEHLNVPAQILLA